MNKEELEILKNKAWKKKLEAMDKAEDWLNEDEVVAWSDGFNDCYEAMKELSKPNESIKGGIMILTKEQREELLEASKPLMKFLADNFHPHVEVRVDCSDAVIMEQSARVRTEEFVKD